jgi:hypothetical protein
MMARNLKSSAKAERADHRLPPDERLDRDAEDVLLPIEELDRPADSRLTAGDLKRAAAKARGAMGISTKHDPDLKIPHTRESLDKGATKAGADDPDAARTRTTRSNAEIAEGVTSTARKSPAPTAARVGGDTGPGGSGRAINKRTGATRQRAPAPGNVTTVPKREAITGQKESKRTGIRSTSSTGGSHPPKASARAGTAKGGSRAKGAGGTTIE